MPTTYDRWVAIQKQTAAGAKPTSADQTSLRLMAQAEVSAQHLTADPHWDHFLRLISAASKEVAGALAAYEAILCDPRVVEQGEIIKAKIALHGLRNQHLTLEWVSELPKALMANGAAARKLIVQTPDTDGGNAPVA